MKALTGYRLRVGEDLGDVLVHFDEQVVLLRYVIVPLFDHGVDPLRERLAENGVAHVDQPLPRKLVPVELVGQEDEHLRGVSRLRQDVLDGQAFVLGREQVGHLGALYDYSIRQ